MLQAMHGRGPHKEESPHVPWDSQIPATRSCRKFYAIEINTGPLPLIQTMVLP